MNINKKDITIVILAGGKSERMNGQDKGLMQINKKYVIKHLYNICKEYSDEVYVNANRNLDIYNEMGLITWQDILENYQGPLAGIYTSLLNTKTKYMITLPCDGPLLNHVYFKRMTDTNGDFDIRAAHDGNRIHTGQRKIDKWYNQCNLELVDFSDEKNIFININSQKDLIEYKKLINESMK
jgi:molybdopterin-guanine dinucleotide biosynthesis protein A